LIKDRVVLTVDALYTLGLGPPDIGGTVKPETFTAPGGRKRRQMV